MISVAQEMEGVKWEALAVSPWLGVLLMQVRTAWEPLAYEAVTESARL